MTPHNENNRAAWLQGPLAVCSAPPGEGQVKSPCRLVLLGAPGVGKGTQALLLSQHLGACHLSTGDVFRAAKSRCEGDHTPAMKLAFEHMRSGALVPDSTVWGIVRERSGCLRCQGGFILDGFPRTLGQAGELKQLMEDEKLPLTAVVNYELPIAEIVSRLSGRRTCGNCKSVFHVTGLPPKTDGLCDHCGGTLYQREDDHPDSVKVRLEAYHRATTPLVEFYTNLGLIETVAATGTPEAICARTLTALGMRRGDRNGR